MRRSAQCLPAYANSPASLQANAPVFIGKGLLENRAKNPGVETTMFRTMAVLCLSVLFPAAGAESAEAQEVYVPLMQDFSADAALAKQRGIPLLVLMAADYCTYCQYIEKHFLKPMIISGDYQDKVIIRVLYIDGFTPVKDFDGRSVMPDEVAARYQATLTPTVLLLGPGGEELAPRLVGISSKDFYGAYLDQRIETADEKMRSAG